VSDLKSHGRAANDDCTCRRIFISKLVGYLEQIFLTGNIYCNCLLLKKMFFYQNKNVDISGLHFYVVVNIKIMSSGM